MTTNKELFIAYKIIKKIMDEDKLAMDNSFRRVQCYLSNKLCDQLEDGEIFESLK